MAIYNDLFDTEAIATEAMNLQMEKYGGRYLQLAEKFSDNFQYNRVEGLRLSYGIGFTNPGIRNSSLSLRHQRCSLWMVAVRGNHPSVEGPSAH